MEKGLKERLVWKELGSAVDGILQWETHTGEIVICLSLSQMFILIIYKLTKTF